MLLPAHHDSILSAHNGIKNASVPNSGRSANKTNHHYRLIMSSFYTAAIIGTVTGGVSSLENPGEIRSTFHDQQRYRAGSVLLVLYFMVISLID